MSDKSIYAKIGSKWSRYYGSRQPDRTRWWQSPHIIRRINQKVSGVPAEGLSTGLISRAKTIAGYDRLPFTCGVSVGCGNAIKEIELISEGVVKSFKLFELSEECIRQGKELAAEKGLLEQTEFICGDAFEIIKADERFDFVHWNNSLHHMFDVEKAVAWSFRVLNKGGMFYMDDFVGPTRFQWSDKMLEIASAIRHALPERYLLHHEDAGENTCKAVVTRLCGLSMPKAVLPKLVNRPDADAIIADDPSEAADSERILESVKKYFPDAEITLTGGVVYHLALNDILRNFDESGDRHLLDLLMIIDGLCADLGETHYATALSIKS